MALDPTHVDVAVTGAVYAAAAGATVTAPTTAIIALDTDLIDLGYVGPDGVTEHYEEDVTEIVAWQGGAVVRTMISKSKATFKFQLIENKKSVVELYHKGSTIVTDGGTGYKVDVKTPVADPRAFNIDVIDGTKHLRIFIPQGEVSERGDIVYSMGGDPIGYEVTITAYPVSGTVCTKLYDGAAWGAA